MNATHSRFVKALAATAAASFAFAASADGTVIPNLYFTMGSGSSSHSYSAGEIGGSWANANRTYGFAGSTAPLTDSPVGLAVSWNLLVNSDPFIVGNISVTNTGTTTREFFLHLILPKGTPASHSRVGGSVTGTVTDRNGNGAVLSSIGDSGLFTAITDFGASTRATAGSLLSSTTITAGSFQSSSLGPASFGDPIPSQLHGLVAENIAMQFRFSLTAGDSASFTSIFVVEAVPAPGAVALMGLAGLRRRRRR